MEIPFIISEGLISEQFLGGNEAERAALKRHYLAARAVITISRQNLDYLRARLGVPADLGVVVPNSPADSYFEPVDKTVRAARRRELGLSEDDILYFTAAGLRPMREFLEQQIAKFGLVERVHMLGHSWDVAEWFDAADMFMWPSLGEGMPAVVLRPWPRACR